MLKGFMDHWVPTKEHISRFWKSDIKTVLDQIDHLKKEIDFNNFTFYTKWYTNGIHSSLPFLNNNPEASNVKTQNAWGRQIIEYLHERKISVGAMLQLLTYEKESWNTDASIGEWDVRSVAETDLPTCVADFTDSSFIKRTIEIIKEQLMEFSEIDYLFLEFEGTSLDRLEEIYQKWPKDQKPDLEAVTYNDDMVEYCRSIYVGINFLWSEQGQEMLKFYFKRILREIDDFLKELGYKGEVGIVHQLYNCEAFVFPEILPDKNWWLLPWWYWVHEAPDIPTEVISRRKLASKALLKEWKEKGYKVCYIGDVALGRNGLGHVKEFYDYCTDISLDGYIGMGNPAVDIGLRWIDVDDESVLAARDLYKSLYEVK